MTADAVILSDAEAAQRRAADPEASVWVAASAGTGKTKVLTDRVLSLMLTGTRPQHILCLTFTRAAAAEMANRIAEVLGAWATAADAALEETLTGHLGRQPDDDIRRRARRLFAQVLDTPGGMNIQTIHAFCQSLLGRFPLEAGIAPHFTVLEERDAEEMLAAAREEVLARADAAADGPLARALADVTAHIHESAFSDLMGALAGARGRLRRLIDRHGTVEDTIAATRRLLGLEDGATPRSVVAAACEDQAFDALGLRLAVSALNEGTATDEKRARVLAEWLAAGADGRAAGFDAYADALLADRQTKVRARLITRNAAASTPGAAEILETEAGRVLRAVMERRAAVTAQATAGLLSLGDALLGAYRRQKERRAVLDYDDLILTARDLLHREGVAPWVLFKLDGGIDHILIDEAQDTNPEQWQVVAALAGEFFAGAGAREAPRTVYAVGDVKQSIYSFQRADPAAFQDMRELFAGRVPAAGQTWHEEELTISFRSTPAVLGAVDAVFARDAAADGVALDGRPITHKARRHGDGGLVEVWPPVEPRETDPPVPWKPPVERIAGDSPPTRLADLIAARIHRMVDGKEWLEARGRPIRPGDVIVLVRRRTGFVEDLVRALKRRDVEVAGVDRMVLTEQMAVMDLVALGRFLLLPEDDLTLATVLKGPLIGLDEDQLFRLAYGRKGSLWEALKHKAAEDAACAGAWRDLSALLARTDYTPPFELYTHVLGAGRGREKLIGRLGRDAEDPIAEFLDLALAFERSHTASLESFLHWLEAGAVEVKRDLEHEQRDAVRIMTVHGAKGLEAPIVFLPDTMQVPMRTPPLLWPADPAGGGELLLWPPARAWYEDVSERESARVKQRRDAEYRRLLYVAMTRAEDRLYVCGWRGRNAPPEGCWYDLVRAGLEDAGVEEADDPFLAAAAEIGDSRVLRLTSPQVTEPKRADAARTEIEGLDTLLPWARRPPPRESRPPRPLAPSRPADEEPPVRSPLGADDGARFKRGRLIHRLLQTLPDLAPAARAAAARAYLARPVHKLSRQAQAGIAAEIRAVLDHPDCRSLFGPGSRAEVPLIGEVSGHVISGQVDRLLVTAEAVSVIDFKTNRAPPESGDRVPAVYLRQMAAYREVLRRIYAGRPVRCFLLWTDGPCLMPLADGVLDGYVP
ncbi:MAG: double-strand break repair helicase AddA [Rhodospirillales bacterium]